jgi:hypothetical protein
VLWLVFSCLSYNSSSFFISIFETPRDSKLNRTKNIFILHLTFKYPNTNKKFKHYYFETFACAKKKKILIHLFLPLLHNCCHYDHISSPPSFLCRPTTPKGPTELLQVPITASDAISPSIEHLTLIFERQTLASTRNQAPSTSNQKGQQ